LILTLTGCSKSFLDKHSLTQLGENSFWQAEQYAYLGINGIYEVLQDPSLFSGNLNGTAGLTQYDCFGDNEPLTTQILPYYPPVDVTGKVILELPIHSQR